MTCTHEELDDNDFCIECREPVQTYTSCEECDWFGIPIIDSGAPEFCNACLERDIEACKRELARTDLRPHIRECLEGALEEAQDDLKYFFDRQKWMDESERRANRLGVAA